MQTSKNITIIDADYTQWVQNLIERYKCSSVKAAVKVNEEQLKFNWFLGRDIVEMKVEERWGESVIERLSKDLKEAMPFVEGLSVTNLRYCRRFYQLYSQHFEFRPQVEGEIQSTSEIAITSDIFRVPWGHHKLIIDKVKGDLEKAMFYTRQTVENGWSRALLQNWIDTGLYERSGKAITNFTEALPDIHSDLAQEITKDPYNFAFAGVRDKYNEKVLKESLLNNITEFLIELGTGFAYIGKEYRLQIGETENFIDLLFYNVKLRCYVVIEVKTTKFEPKDIGQLGTYVTAANHILREEEIDNPTIGLLICKSKDNVLARYALESTSQPIGISEYELEKFYPTKLEGTIPTIEELEKQL